MCEACKTGVQFVQNLLKSEAVKVSHLVNSDDDDDDIHDYKHCNCYLLSNHNLYISSLWLYTNELLLCLLNTFKN